MALGFIPVEHYRTKFYQKERESKKFQTMDEEQLATVAKKLYRKEEISSNDVNPFQSPRITKLDKYIKVLQYLSNPSIHMEIKTFDERLAYLIMAVDPYLVTFKEFLKINLMTIEEITRIEDLKERNRLFDERNQIICEYESTVRDQIGFFDAKLLKYEELFFKRFYNEKELITQVGQHNEDKFLLLSCLIQSFDGISNERYQELVEKAEVWLSMVPEKYRSKIATYSITNQKDLIGLDTLAEQYAFYILIVDGNLDMLRIYEEESMIPKTEERIQEGFGFYNPSMITLEKLFHSRFCPEKKISIWSDTK